EFDRVVCYDDLATGGSIVIFNKDRNILEAAKEYMDFFVDESCGYCTPCRVGNTLMRNCLENINSGKGSSGDFDYLEGLGNTMKMTSRCGLGQTSPNPILTTLKNFKKLYENVINNEDDGLMPSFDIKEALKDGEALAGRPSVKH
ncbi:MAG: NADH:ubiquinone oxidoreductase, partial [Colwellia sp.]|nr:NADH:ubiquinone oxidoreductase [Colwellia sp.]